MTKGELERLAILETLVAGHGVVLGEIRVDVKTLLAAKNVQVGVMQVINRLLPLAISIIALGVSVTGSAPQ